MNVENLTAVCALCSSHSNALNHTSQLASGGSRLPGASWPLPWNGHPLPQVLVKPR